MVSEKRGWNATLFILQIAVGVMLAVGGIWALQGGGDFAASAIKDLVEGDLEGILVIVFGVIELLVGIFMILKLLIGDRFGSFGSVLVLIATVVWIAAIVLSDVLGAKGIINGGTRNFLEWIYRFAQHLIILGAILAVK
ncbi:hypothetical protein [Treponema sp.]|uniref:hypothetical protein n=1 Tax=Treponema sp. TaxID=166 RepID=UPI003F08D2DA